ncbi:MAG: hypothetical protein RRB13_11850 [bacterium]|nr:hypothetical protein [bacterium]
MEALACRWGQARPHQVGELSAEELVRAAAKALWLEAREIKNQAKLQGVRID